MALVAEAPRRSTLLLQVLAFAVQVLIAVSFEVGDDLGRGLVSQHGTAQGVENARRVVEFEAAHGFFVEPAWQLFFERTHHILVFTVTWPDVIHVVNAVYVLGHVGVTLAVAVWLYVYRRHAFGFVRNTVILTNLFALVVYENFPVAPPRLSGPLSFDHHVFTFQDTVFGVVQGGRVVGTSLAYNEFSAMPSVHMAWALVVGAVLIVLAPSWLAKLFGFLYPGLMLAAVVVTGNHYLMDVVGGAGVLLLATLCAFAFERYKDTLPRVRRARLPSEAEP
jgi:membrane-associated phospholipid phosphatase